MTTRTRGRDGGALLIISPVHNEIAHIERVIVALARQSRPPDLWLVADDRSDDGTSEALRKHEREIPFLRVSRVPAAPFRSADGLAQALEARAFNLALRSIDCTRFTHIGKVDGDIELPRECFQRILASFESNPRLGISGGSLVEPRRRGARWIRVPAPKTHVHGALKVYSRGCFDAIGGIEERLGWDGIDETRARMAGFETTRLDDVVALHHRATGDAGGQLRGRARHGECAYIAHQSPSWVLLRAAKMGLKTEPRVIAGLAFMGGYARSALRRVPRVDDDAFRRFVRAETRERMRLAHVRSEGTNR